MNPADPLATLVRPRLATLLMQLAGRRQGTARQGFGERLGQLIDLSHSVALAEALDPRAQPLDPYAEGAPERARQDFLRVRAGMLASVLRSLRGEGPARLCWPAPETQQVLEPGQFGRFYAAHQREMEARVRGLQERTRAALCGISPEFASLTRLDEALGNALAAHGRHHFAAIPERVMERAEALLKETGGEQALARDIQALLLAEVDARLLPARGLIEALDEHDLLLSTEDSETA